MGKLRLATLVLVVLALAPAPAAGQVMLGPLGADLRLSSMGPDGNPAYDADSGNIAYNPAANEYLVVWTGDDNAGLLVDEEAEVYAQRLSASGIPISGRVRVSDMGPDGDTVYDAFGPRVAYNSADNQYLVVWTGDDNTGALVDGELEIFAQRLTALGVEVGTNDIRVSDMGTDGSASFVGAGASIAYNSGSNEYLVTWRGDDNTAPLVDGEVEIFGQRLTAGGGAAGVNDFRISDMGPNGNIGFAGAFPSVAYNSDDNQYLVTWQGDDDTAPLVNDEDEIFGQRLNSVGGEVGADFRISDMGPNGDTIYDAASPSVAYNPVDNQYLVTWNGDDNTAPLVESEQEAFGQRLTAAGTEVGANDFRVSDMGPDGDANLGALNVRVAHNPVANQYAVVWEGDDVAPLVNNEIEIFGQQLDATGAELGANDFRISDMGPDGSTTFAAGDARLAYNPVANQYLVTWTGDDNTAPLVNDETEIFGRLLAEIPVPSGAGPPGAGPPGAGTPGAGPPGAGAPAADTVAPRLLSLTLSPTAFAAFSSGPSVRQAATRGTRVTYRLSEAATATFRVQRVLAGRVVGGRCVRPTRANRDRPRCKRYRTLSGRFRHDGAAGLNRFRYSGRLAGRKLRVGPYRLVVTARDPAANASTPSRRLFRIVR